jgi:hypothetical protein
MTDHHAVAKLESLAIEKMPTDSLLRR